MARPLRIQFENAYYHVTCRGNAQQAIFKATPTDTNTAVDTMIDYRLIALAVAIAQHPVGIA